MPRSYIAQMEEDTEGQRKMRILRPADDDAAGQLRGRALGETEDDTFGHPLRHISPEPIDADQGLYVVEVDSDEDVTGQVYRQQSPHPGGEDGQGSV